MSKFWMRHSPGRVRRIEAGRVACELHGGDAAVDDCRDCPRFLGILHEGPRWSVLCSPEARHSDVPGQSTP
jgi:hypothetical protein